MKKCISLAITFLMLFSGPVFAEDGAEPIQIGDKVVYRYKAVFGYKYSGGWEVVAELADGKVKIVRSLEGRQQEKDVWPKNISESVESLNGLNVGDVFKDKYQTLFEIIGLSKSGAVIMSERGKGSSPLANKYAEINSFKFAEAASGVSTLVHAVVGIRTIECSLFF